VLNLVDEKYMRLAVEKAREGIANGQEPFGACVIKSGEVVSVAHNTIRVDNDVTAHAEMNAIREPCKKLETIDLSGCEIYATFKPCAMCQAACEMANISRIYYGVGPEYFGASPGKYSIEIIAGILEKECSELVQGRF
jgi:tRNA(Arg) A34 adenosine deaminase TadA